MRAQSLQDLHMGIARTDIPRLRLRGGGLPVQPTALSDISVTLL